MTLSVKSENRTIQRHPPIVIAGAGPVGLYAAVLLVNAGHRVIVLEKNHDLPLDMRASTFHPSTLDLLGACGLADPLIFRGSIMQGWQYMIHGTKNHAVFDLECIRDATDHPFRLICEQYHFSNLAVEQLVRNPLFEIRFGHEIVSLENRQDRALLRLQTSTGEQEIETPWLIAADGGHSTVRGQLGLSFEHQSPPVTSISLVLNHPFENDVPGILGVNFVWTQNGFYSLRQIRDLWRFSYQPDPDLPIGEAVSEAATQSYLQALFPSLEPYEIQHRLHYTIQPGCLSSFRQGRVLFAGDAAHLESPAGGLGMNSGMHDAHCLVEHLLPVLDGADDDWLDRYSRRRRTIAIEEVQRLSAREERWRRETSPVKRAAIWQELLEIVSDDAKTREFLLDLSLIRSRQREADID